MKIPAKLERDKLYKLPLVPFKLLNSVCKAKKIIKKYKPNVIFSKGGFVSVPVCIAGKLLKINVISHESDLTLGLSNKIIYKFCSRFCTTFEKTAQNLKKAVYTGSPIRKTLLHGNKQKGLEITKLNSNKPILLVTGGSTGAKKLNDIIENSFKELIKTFNIIHLTGKNKKTNLENSPYYCQMEFCSEIEHLLVLADVVISRAGSNAICELFFLNKPMILIPLSNKASRGDQVENAEYFKSLKVCEVLQESKLTTSSLLTTLEKIIKNKETYIKNMKNSNLKLNGEENIVKEILKFTK